jgi:UrcA family protein
MRGIHEEIHVHTKSSVMSSWSVLGTAAVACALFIGNAAAEEHPVTVAFQVSAKGLDLSQPAGAQELYRRLQRAAVEVCKPGALVALEPVSDRRACSEKALADAIRSVNMPLLTQVYLKAHTLEEAATHGIEVTPQAVAMAAAASGARTAPDTRASTTR